MANAFVRKTMEKGNFITLERLSGFSSGSRMPDEAAQLFYVESFSIVDFLIKEFGKDKFVSFCQDLRDKKNLERAIASNYPFSNIQELGVAWDKYLKNG